MVAQPPPLRHCRLLQVKHRVPPRVHTRRNPHSRASQAAAVNHQASRTIHRLRTLRVPVPMMKTTTMTVRIRQAPLHRGLLRHRPVGAVGVLHCHRQSQKASDTTEAIVGMRKSAVPLHTAPSMARAVVSHHVLDHLHMDTTRMLGATVVTVIGGSQGSHLKQAGCRQVVEEGGLGMVATMTGTRAGHVAPALPAPVHPQTLSARPPAAVPSPAKGHPHHTHLENRERKRSLARGAGTERSS